MTTAALGLACCAAALAQQSFAPESDRTPAMQPAPHPDVLTPNRRISTPDWKIGVRAGINRSSYSNDRYLDNNLLDVGQTEGEIDVYTTAAGFGYSAGIDVEYPTSAGISWVLSIVYEHASFGGSGPVSEPCERNDGTIVTGSAIHEFKASVGFVKVVPQVKFSFPSWYLVAGVAGAHPLSSTLERTRKMGATDCYYPGTDHVGTLRESGAIPAMVGVHYALRLGGGLIYRLSERLVFAPELTLDFGSSRLNKSPDSDLGVYAASVTLRYDVR